MHDFIQFLGPQFTFVLILVLGSLVAVTGLVLGCVWMTQRYLAGKQQLAAELVHEMLAAGFTAAEVQHTLEGAGLFERSVVRDFVRDLGISMKAKAGVPASS